MKQKRSIATLLLIALGATSIGAAPAFADDTAPVTDTAPVVTEDQTPTSAINGATSD